MPVGRALFWVPGDGFGVRLCSDRSFVPQDDGTGGGRW
jgi:hypothetical protein